MTDFEDIVGGLAAEFEEIDTDGIVDVSKLSIKELLEVITTADEMLLDASQAVRPREQWARDLHSLRNAAQLEYRRRTS